MSPVETTDFRDRVRIVLIEPAQSRNIGAVARAMMNLGFSDLRLVAPRGYDREQAGVAARDAAALLDTAQIHATFDDALVGAEEVVGLALRTGDNPARFVTLPGWSAARAAAGTVPTTALVFGPEDDDLRREHLEKCRFVVRIPSTAAYPSFNLAQSVLLTLYELTRALPTGTPPEPELPAENERAQLERLVESVMVLSGFVRPGSPAPAPEVVRNALRRTLLTRREHGILLALFSRIESALRRSRSAP